MASSSRKLRQLSAAPTGKQFFRVHPVITLPIVSVAGRDERLSESESIIGVTRVTQDDTPGVLWILIAEDSSLDESWISLPYSVDPKGFAVPVAEKSDLLSITLVGDAAKDVKAYTFGEWAAYGVISPSWKILDSTLTSLHIGQGITSIGVYAFDGCTGIQGNLVIPDSVTAIGQGAFGSWNAIGTLTLHEGLLTIGNNAFELSDFRGALVIPDSVTFIGEEAFRDCTGFTSLTLGSGITEIEDAAFKCSSGFTGPLVIPAGVTNIKEEAFEECFGFTSLTLPEGLLTIGDETFEDCTGFTGTLTLPESLTRIDEDAFNGCDGFTGSLVIPDNVTEIEDYAFQDCSGFNVTLTIGSGLTDPAKFGTEVFRGCFGFASVIISSGVTEIPEGTFHTCTGLNSVTIPDSVTSIGGRAFWDCTALTSVTIPDSVTSIGDDAFYSCGALTSVTIGDSVTSIGWGAFWGCTALTSVTIPSSVTTIDYGAFHSCTSLTTVNCRVTKTILEFGGDVLLNSGVTAIHALASDTTWTAGAGQTIAGKSGITVTKDLT